MRIINQTFRRFGGFLGQSHEGRRDLYDVFGYPKQITPEMLYGVYTRQDIANRIVRSFSQATWRDMATIRDEAGDSTDKGSEGYSEFTAAVDKFFEEKNILHYLERADRLASIGRFGVLVMGFQDGQPLSQPLGDGRFPLLYIQPYGEPHVSVTSWDQDETSPRFGLPLAYTCMLGSSVEGGPSVPGRSVHVHWSRVIHLSEYLEEDNVFGLPRLFPIYNRLMDLEKVVGGSAETFWLAANRGLALWADKEASLDEEDIKAMKAQADEFQHQQRRYLVGTGMTAQVLGSEDPDPGPNAEKLLDLISGAVGIPKRILIGSERGELASGQDENNWSARIDERRRNFATPRVLRPFVNKMIATGNLPEPEGMWWVEWPETSVLGAVEESMVLMNRTSALVNYSNAPGASLVVPEQEFRKDFLGLEPDSDYSLPLEDDLDEDPLIEDDEDEDGGQDEGPTTNAALRTLYAYRPVLNARAVLRWAAKQGLRDLVDEADLHVTIGWCENAFDWMKIGGAVPSELENDAGQLMIPPGGVRIVESIGGGGATALLFTCHALSARHQQMVDAGMEWPYEGYQPHITLSWGEQDPNLEILPYTGAIALGPEVVRENN